MARVFITGSAGGLGLMAGELLASQGHSVVLHARNEVRARDARTALPQAAAVVVGDLSTIAAMRTVADQANSLGRFDAVIHNVGIGYREPRRVTTEDGRSQLWAVNVLAPYVLTALMERAARTRWIATAARTACTTLLKSAMTLSAAAPKMHLARSEMMRRYAPRVRMVASSSAAMSRLYPTTSAASKAASRRVVIRERPVEGAWHCTGSKHSHRKLRP
jgi:NAD(P)-dependent dehydrogenase (short-subunit alcohol dehydrogenase family)